MLDYYTCDQVAQMYHVQKDTVYGWIRERKMGAMKIGREYRILPQHLEKFEESCQVGC